MNNIAHLDASLVAGTTLDHIYDGHLPVDVVHSYTNATVLPVRVLHKRAEILRREEVTIVV